MMGVGLRSQVDVDGKERGILLITLLIMRVFFDFLNGRKIIDGVLRWQGILFVLGFLMFGSLVIRLEQLLSSFDIEGL
jgi:hypothetical protein